MYFERQVGGNCRIHATNNLVGESLISVSEFTEFAEQFSKSYWIQESAMAFDFVTEDSLLLPAYALERRRPDLLSLAVMPGSASIWGFAPGREAEFVLGLDPDRMVGVYIFNAGHIWCARRTEDGWFLCDSLRSGPTPMPLARALRGGKIMFAPVFPTEAAGVLRPILMQAMERGLASDWASTAMLATPLEVEDPCRLRRYAFAAMGSLGVALATSVRFLSRTGHIHFANDISARMHKSYELVLLDFEEFVTRVKDIAREVLARLET